MIEFIQKRSDMEVCDGEGFFDNSARFTTFVCGRVIRSTLVI